MTGKMDPGNSCNHYDVIRIAPLVIENARILISFGDPGLDPDPHVFGPPRSGSGSISQRYGSGSVPGSFPFLINVLCGLK
jgi:hypothetical protein